MLARKMAIHALDKYQYLKFVNVVNLKAPLQEGESGTARIHAFLLKCRGNKGTGLV